jgi:hypothetical protein
MRRLALLLLILPAAALWSAGCDEASTQPLAAPANPGADLPTPSFARGSKESGTNIGIEVVSHQINWPTPVQVIDGMARIGVGVQCPTGKVVLGGGGWVTGTNGGWSMTLSKPDRESCPPLEYCEWQAAWESPTGDPANPNGFVGTIAYAVCGAVK